MVHLASISCFGTSTLINYPFSFVLPKQNVFPTPWLLVDQPVDGHAAPASRFDRSLHTTAPPLQEPQKQDVWLHYNHNLDVPTPQLAQVPSWLNAGPEKKEATKRKYVATTQLLDSLPQLFDQMVRVHPLL